MDTFEGGRTDVVDEEFSGRPSKTEVCRLSRLSGPERGHIMPCGNANF